MITIVPEKDWEVIRHYLESGILIPEHVFQELPEEDQERIEDAGMFDYNFGGEADVVIDLILNKDAYALRHLRSIAEEQGEKT